MNNQEIEHVVEHINERIEMHKEKGDGMLYSMGAIDAYSDCKKWLKEALNTEVRP